jgi:hypothetical protein
MRRMHTVLYICQHPFMSRDQYVPEVLDMLDANCVAVNEMINSLQLSHVDASDTSYKLD